MGLFGSLFGWDQTMAAVNAVLASHLIQHAGDAERKRIAAEVVQIVQSVQRRLSETEILQSLSGESRVVQMNFIAIACDNLYIPPPIPNNTWTRVKNPYATEDQVDAARIESAIQAVLQQDTARIKWPGKNVRVNFAVMAATGALEEKAS